MQAWGSGVEKKIKILMGSHKHAICPYKEENREGAESGETPLGISKNGSRKQLIKQEGGSRL